MRILLRDSHNGLFYAGPERWTEDHSKAAEFEDTSKAIDEAWGTCTSEMEIVMRFDDPFLEIPLSIVAPSDQPTLIEE
jgi:hypothetical protein